MDSGTWQAIAHGVARVRHNLASKPPALLFNRISQVVQWKRIHLPAGDVGLIPESGRSLGEGNGHPFQYSCWKNPMDRGVLCAAVHGSQRVRHD